MGANSMFDLVKELTELPGPIGREEAVQEWLEQHWGARCESVQVDRLRNLVAHIGGEGPRILLAAHADEICFMVKSISPEGFVFLSSHTKDELGYPSKGSFPVGQPALILGRREPVAGVFTSITGHLIGSKTQEYEHRLGWNDIFVETAANRVQDLEELGVFPGCRVIWNPPTRRLGKRIVGKAMDDRAGLAILTALISELKPSELAYDTYFGSTIQEEIGLAGASSIGQSLDFDLAIALDVGLSGDVPGVDARNMPIGLGKGPTLVYQDSMIHYDYTLTEHLASLAETQGIPIQRAVFQSYGSDGMNVCPTRDSIRTSGLPNSLYP